MAKNIKLLENLKSKVTYENKTIYGIVMIVLGLIIWGLTHDYLGIMDIIIIMIPSILLVIPNESVKNSKIMGIILAIVLIFIILSCIGSLMGVEDIVSYYYREYQYYYASAYMDYKGLYYSIMGQIIFVYVAQIVYSILNLVSCYMMSIPTKKNESKAVASNSNNEEQVLNWMKILNSAHHVVRMFNVFSHIHNGDIYGEPQGDYCYK